ncbi:MAG: 2-amino-4-hydroxy-6-hydroxymethyldihydropteridine diphosphokinase [Gammaproteobacteria bacterium]|nr:2-amino-4-hydroxy-6-hydroxymethyldihydropteridine diphosphokinase [Gammaproteobacteria bacterium]NVK88146.1 2-amino-4-hydroxy-6-hydroxymethyldihydropteridine diphosphokinase [Gammaproteobacteria bacterium]
MPQIYVSIGTNVARERNLEIALRELTSAFGPLTISPVYQSEAMGFQGDDFYNLVAGFYSDWSIAQLNQCFKAIERLSGRDHSAPKFSDRTLDIDLLNYGDQICETPVVLPREEILYHAFVLQPLNDIAPNWLHPVTQQSVALMWQNFAQKQRLNAIPDPIDMESYR